ncbi:MAG: hypothetical protein LUO93_08515 [Methanomicrobiales archaeon]|nr:hypothetical protein [Methanomicrobiales archaeon]
MASRSVLVSRQVYAKDSPTVDSPLLFDYFDVTNRSSELKLIDEKIFKALALWEKYSVHHEVILFA